MISWAQELQALQQTTKVHARGEVRLYAFSGDRAMWKAVPSLVCWAGLLTLGSSLEAAVIYIGDAASQGRTLTNGGGTRADSVTNLTYVSTHASNLYTAPEAWKVRLTEVNFFADAGGTLIPFVARYNGASNQLGSSYTVLAIGDPITVSPADSLINAQFKVGGVNPVLSLNAGDVLAAGWQQQGNLVYISGYAGSGVPEYIANGLALPATVGNSLTLNSNWVFDRMMQFNLGFEIVPEPSTLVLLGMAGVAVLFYARRRHFLK
jgi:hypothetical protein